MIFISILLDGFLPFLRCEKLRRNVLSLLSGKVSADAGLAG
jgi:hypothetical protein